MIQKTFLKQNVKAFVCCIIEGLRGRFASPWVSGFLGESARLHSSLYKKNVWESV